MHSLLLRRPSFERNGIIQSEQDSAVLLYRTDPSDDWHSIEYTQIGIWSIGNFFVDNLPKGEYCVAVVDDTFVGIQDNKAASIPQLKVFPNPSSSVFKIETVQSGKLKFYDINGKMLDTVHVDKGGEIVKWKPGNLPPGTYFARLFSEQNKPLAFGRLVIVE